MRGKLYRALLPRYLHSSFANEYCIELEIQREKKQDEKRLWIRALVIFHDAFSLLPGTSLLPVRLTTQPCFVSLQDDPPTGGKTFCRKCSWELVSLRLAAAHFWGLTWNMQSSGVLSYYTFTFRVNEKPHDNCVVLNFTGNIKDYREPPSFL